MRHTLSHAATAIPVQSTPSCVQKRLSSAATSAAVIAGDTSASATHSSCRTFALTRSSESGAPWRSSSSASEET